ncbi:MAG: hypothetical protein JXR52_08405 [Bacteroidales bacterium]|nr:hypothetical protein [Bacteroidales bacterium]
MGISEIAYKKFDNTEGPVYKIMLSDVERIRYENGSEDVFGEPFTGDSAETEPAAEALPDAVDTVSVKPFRHYLMGGFNFITRKNK